MQTNTLSEKNSLLTQCKDIILNTTKRFGTGVLATAVITPLSSGMAFLAQLTGYFERMDPIKSHSETLRNIGIAASEAERIANSQCPTQEYVHHINHEYPHWGLTVEMVKTIQIVSVGIVVPISEEILFRGILQDLLLDKLVKRTVKAYATDKAKLLDTTAAKTARIGLTALLFSAYHLQNRGILSDDYVKLQVLSTFFMGLGFGVLKESKAGLTGAIAAHICNNMLALSPSLMRC